MQVAKPTMPTISDDITMRARINRVEGLGVVDSKFKTIFLRNYGCLVGCMSRRKFKRNFALTHTPADEMHRCSRLFAKWAILPVGAFANGVLRTSPTIGLDTP
ncbi:MAG: hypothetical protein RLY14_123, partial [Planctomycetota bacterium]